MQRFCREKEADSQPDGGDSLRAHPQGSERSAGFVPTSDLRKDESEVELILSDEE
jgi:hypothetical protein